MDEETDEEMDEETDEEMNEGTDDKTNENAVRKYMKKKEVLRQQRLLGQRFMNQISDMHQ